MTVPMKLKYIRRIARKDHVCGWWDCQETIPKGEQYMQVNEWRQAYRWCWECWSKKTR